MNELVLFHYDNQTISLSGLKHIPGVGESVSLSAYAARTGKYPKFTEVHPLTVTGVHHLISDNEHLINIMLKK